MGAPLVYGRPDTWDGFWYVVLAAQFRGDIVDPFGDLGGKAAELAGIAVAQLGIVSALVFVPAAGAFFGTVPLTAVEFAFLAALAVLVLLADESRKAITRLLRTGREPGPTGGSARP
jgi:hypothetical protein